MDKSITICDSKVIDQDTKTIKSENKLSKYLNKRNLKILLLIAIGIVSMIVLWGFSTNNEKSSNIQKTYSNNYISTIDYCEMIENKLIEVLSAVDGAGTVKVMVAVDGSPELVYANEQDQTSSSNSSGSVTTSTYSSPIIIDANGGSSALVMTEILPAIKGVIVVSSGAGNVATKLDLLNAVSTLLDISVNQVTVLKGV